jgi:CRISPR-associated protein Csd1
MILAALKQYYDSRVAAGDDLPAFGFAETSVVGAITLNDNGDVSALSDLHEERPGTNKKRPRTNKKGEQFGVDWRPQPQVVPQMPNRRFLCGNTRYLLGYVPAGDAGTNQEKQRRSARKTFDAARTLHEAVLAGVDDPAAAAILAFFRQWRVEDAAALFAGKPSLATGWLVFRLKLHQMNVFKVL